MAFIDTQLKEITDIAVKKEWERTLRLNKLYFEMMRKGGQK